MNNGKRLIGQGAFSGWLLCAVLVVAANAADAQIRSSNLIQKPWSRSWPGWVGTYDDRQKHPELDGESYNRVSRKPIGVSSATSAIATRNVIFLASAFLGRALPSQLAPLTYVNQTQGGLLAPGAFVIGGKQTRAGFVAIMTEDGDRSFEDCGLLRLSKRVAGVRYRSSAWRVPAEAFHDNRDECAGAYRHTAAGPRGICNHSVHGQWASAT